MEVGPNSEVSRQIFDSFAKVSNGMPNDAVLVACLNMIVNCILQNYGRRDQAEALMKELFEKGLPMLLDNYDSVTGRVRSVVPFNQIVNPGVITGVGHVTGVGRLTAKSATTKG